VVAATILIALGIVDAEGQDASDGDGIRKIRHVEDDFLDAERLDPKTDGRPDPRPTVRETEPILGDVRLDFDFSQEPRAPFLLPEHPQTTLVSGKLVR
jgi:hypothetical protein